MPTLTINELMVINNNRAIPQQSVTTFSTVDDIESFIQFWEIEKRKKYLTILELPTSEKEEALSELRYMGITANSLFPGLDGVAKC